MTAGIPAVLKEITPSTTVYYYREPGGALLARQEGTTGSTRRYYHFDGLGSTSMLTNTNGDWTDKYSYDGWGNVLQHSTAAGSIDQPYQYVGQLGYYTHYMIPSYADFRLLQLGVRFYDPQVGRFTQRDPVRDGQNWYAYAGDDPLVWVDPDGRIKQIPTTWKECITKAVDKYCDKSKVSRKMIRCMIYCESRDKSGAERGNGATGLLQIMPEWWDSSNKYYCKHKGWDQPTCDDIVPGFSATKPCDNITCGVYLFCRIHHSSTDEFGTTNNPVGKKCYSDCMKHYAW